MDSAYDDLIAALRTAATPQAAAPPQMKAYLEQVRLHAYRVRDQDVEELKATVSEEEIFEQTVAAAVAAGLERLDAALEALA